MGQPSTAAGQLNENQLGAANANQGSAEVINDAVNDQNNSTESELTIPDGISPEKPKSDGVGDKSVKTNSSDKISETRSMLGSVFNSIKSTLMGDSAVTGAVNEKLVDTAVSPAVSAVSGDDTSSVKTATNVSMLNNVIETTFTLQNVTNHRSRHAQTRIITQERKPVSAFNQLYSIQKRIVLIYIYNDKI